MQSSNPNGSQYLSNWAQDMRQKTKKTKQPQNGLAVGSSAGQMMQMQTGPFISETALKQLQQLYGAGGGGDANNNNKRAQQQTESIGTLPAEAMEVAVRQLPPKSILDNKIVAPKPPATLREQAKITADLMDVDFD